MVEQKPKVLLLGAIETAHDDWKALQEHAEVIQPQSTDRAVFLKECSSPDFANVVAIYRTFESISVTGPVDGELLRALPKTCRFICHNGAGYDQIDVSTATELRICVSNTPTAVNDATADIAIFLMLGCLRNLAPGMAALRKGEWRGKGTALGHDPRGKVLGILGMGGIGRNMAKKARAFGMEVRYYNRTKLSPENEEGCEYVDFDKLLGESDVLSLNLPLNASTRHAISEKEFSKMKKGIVLVNTARGAIMDESALVSALASGQVSSVGLDVFENEPEIHPDLLANENVLLVPHMGTWTEETVEKMERWAIGNVIKAVTEGKLKSIVPEQRDLEKELNGDPRKRQKVE